MTSAALSAPMTSLTVSRWTSSVTLHQLAQKVDKAPFESAKRVSSGSSLYSGCSTSSAAGLQLHLLQDLPISPSSVGATTQSTAGLPTGAFSCLPLKTPEVAVVREAEFSHSDSLQRFVVASPSTNPAAAGSTPDTSAQGPAAGENAALAAAAAAFLPAAAVPCCFCLCCVTKRRAIEHMLERT